MGGFQLQADSEEEGDVTPRDDEEDYADEEDDPALDSQEPSSYVDANGNRRELITDTGEEYSQNYEADEYGETSGPQNLYSEQFEMTGQSGANQVMR